jgi:small-conductance mechanosensitive channel
MTVPPDPTITAQLSGLATNISDWLTSHSNRILVAALVSLALVAALYGVRLAGRSMARPVRPRASWRGVIGRALGSMRFWFMAALALEIVCVYAIAPVELAHPAQVLFVIALGLQAAFFLRELVLGGIEIRAEEADPTGNLGSAIDLLRLFVSCALFFIAAILILSNLGINVTGLLAGLGIGGIAIGLAAQGIFSDLFAALSILFDQPFRRGDMVRWDGMAGQVEAIGLKSTRIRALTGEEIIVSNANLLSKELHNFSRMERRRIVQPLSLIYQTSADMCTALPELLATTIAPLDGCHFVRCGLDVFAASSLDFQLVYDVEAEHQDMILSRKHAVNIAILRAFADHGIAFAYPTQTTFTAAPDGTLVMPYAPQSGNAGIKPSKRPLD